VAEAIIFRLSNLLGPIYSWSSVVHPMCLMK
jgi:hypothetical protein